MTTSALALAGNVVLLVQPLDASRSSIVLTVRLSRDKIPSGQLAAFNALVGLVLHTEAPTSTLGRSQVFRGPRSGPDRGRGGCRARSAAAGATQGVLHRDGAG